MWMLFVLAYGLIKGARDVVKKKAFEKSTVMEVLVMYTLLSFIMVVPDYKNAMTIETKCLLFTAIKAFVIFLAWIFSFNAIKKMPVSLYGVLDLSRVLFSTLLGAVVLNEIMTRNQIIGLVLVLTGLVLINIRKKDSKSDENVKTKYLIMAIASCLLNAVSGTMDKVLMGRMHMKSAQLQFWYMFFLVLMYVVYILIKKIHIDWKNVWKNQWIWILSILFVVADRLLFIANADGASKVTIMTLIKQSGCIVSILGGK